MNRKIYRKIAKRHGVSVAEVKRDMQDAIYKAYTKPDKTAINVKAQNEVFRKGEIPTPAELLRHTVLEVRQRAEKD